MNTPPTDFLYRLTIPEIGNLDQYSHRSLLPLAIPGSFSVTFWLQAHPSHGKRVLINHGNVEDYSEGWSFLIKDETLVFRVKAGDRKPVQVACNLTGSQEWRHLVGVLDLESRRLCIYQNGRLVASSTFPDPFVLPASFTERSEELIIGGYTDRAGGHFDHTFGRNGTGMIDEVRIYSRALAPEEIKSFYHRKYPAPIPLFSTFPISGEAPIKVRFEAEISEDLNRSIKYFLWDLGDGHKKSGRSIKHLYRYAGEYTITLTVIDDAYSTATMKNPITITGQENPLTFSPVFVNGHEGHAGYRIPSIIRAANGDLLAFAEGRLQSFSDSTKTIRLVSKRSRDNGRTWGPLEILARNIVGSEEYVVQHISPVVDTVDHTGRICLVYSKSEHNEWQLAQGEGVSRTCCMISDNHGLTWSEERDITLQVHRPYNPRYAHIYPAAALPENKDAAWSNQRPTLGHAIQLRGTPDNPSTRGRLLYAGTCTKRNAGIFNAYNYIFWSSDLGESWQIGGVIDGLRIDGTSAQGLDEATAVELEDGSVMVNSRNYRDRLPVGCRAVTIVGFDREGRASFKPTYHDKALVCSAVQASILRLSFSDEIDKGGKSRILFSNPNHSRARYNLTVRLSYDEGQTWPVSKVIDPGPSAYSDLVLQADNHIGVLYERGNQGGVFYASFPLEWLTDDQDSLSQPS